MNCNVLIPKMTHDMENELSGTDKIEVTCKLK